MSGDGVGAGLIVEVLPPVAVDQTYSYFAPPGLALAPGDFVKIPLGRREAFGVVWAVNAASGPPGNLKSVISRYDRPELSRNLRDFLDWLARWTLAPRGMALRLATGAGEDAGPPAPRLLYRLAGPPPRRMTPTRARALAAAEGGLAFTKKALMEAAGCGASVIDALVDEGALETLTAPPPPVVRRARSRVLPARSRSRTTTRRERAIGRA